MTSRLVILVATLGTGALGAQDLSQVCSSATHVTVGQWASYQFTSGGDRGGRVRLALVGTERRGDSTAYWFEMTHTPAGDTVHDGVVQLLVTAFGTPTAAIHGLIMKQGGEPARRLPDELVAVLGPQVGQNNPALELARSCVGAVEIGWERVAVPVGTIRALHVKGAEGGEAWLAPDVPFEVVKLRTSQGGELVLTGRGTDAKSSITETPQEVPGLR